MVGVGEQRRRWPRQGAFEHPGRTKPSLSGQLWPMWEQESVGHRLLSHPQSPLCPPFPRTGALWLLRYKSGLALPGCGFARGVCEWHLLLRAVWRWTKQSRPCLSPLLATLVHSLGYSGVFQGTSSSFLSLMGGGRGAASLPPKTNRPFCL